VVQLAGRRSPTPSITYPVERWLELFDTPEACCGKCGCASGTP